jgi:hypothetical protein
MEKAETVVKGQKNKKVVAIATHSSPHLDEIAGICLLKLFGQEKFPGIKRAKIVLWNSSGTPDGRSIDEWEHEGVLIVGMAGSRFDEHPVQGSEGKKGECATTLIARYLGIDDDPALEPILKYVLSVDSKVLDCKDGGQFFDLSALIKMLHKKHPDKPARVIQFAKEAFMAIYEQQKSFFGQTKDEFEAKGQIEMVPGPKGKKVKLLTIESDDPNMQKFARSRFGGICDIIVQKKSSGNVQIFTNRFAGLRINDVVRIVRHAEQKKRGKIVTGDWKQLEAEGTLPGAEMWYYHADGQMLLNGSLTANGVEATALPLSLIVSAVKIGVNPAHFEEKRKAECARKICTSQLKNPCLYYDWGLSRCRTIRYQMKNQ